MRKPLPIRLRGLAAPPPGMEWLAITPNAWARDRDLLTAVWAACEEASCRVTPAQGPLALFHVPADAVVGPMGDIWITPGTPDTSRCIVDWLRVGGGRPAS